MKRFGIIVLGLSLLMADPVGGQDLADPLADGSLVTYQYTGAVGGREGPYTALLPYAGPTSPSVNVYCVDEGRYVRVGDIVTARVTNLQTGTFGSSLLPHRYDGTMGAFQDNLKKAAWLSTQFWTTDTKYWKSLHYAIWSLTSGRDITGNTWAEWFVDEADLNFGTYNGGDYSDWSLLTAEYLDGELLEAGHRAGQSMLVQTTMTATPEPQTYLLMATGLIFLVFVGRRRLKENGF